MTAATDLRRAATLMRERAEAVDDRDYSKRIVAKVGRRTPAGQHIAGMSPAVALAVADWLDAQAADAESFVNGEDGWVTDLWTVANNAALAVARAYLGEDA